MKVVYSDRHQDHDPQLFMVRGRLKRSNEQPERAFRLLAAAERDGHQIVGCDDFGPGPRAAVRAIEGDDEMLRATACCANEVVDALSLPARQSLAAMQRVAQRYGRAWNLTLRDLQMAAQGQSPHDAQDERDGPSSSRHTQ